MATVNVLDFGAVGDDTTDDTTAVQRAVDAAGPGGTVRFPSGIYRVSRIPELHDKNVRLEGPEKPKA